MSVAVKFIGAIISIMSAIITAGTTYIMWFLLDSQGGDIWLAVLFGFWSSAFGVSIAFDLIDRMGMTMIEVNTKSKGAKTRWDKVALSFVAMASMCWWLGSWMTFFLMLGTIVPIIVFTVIYAIIYTVLHTIKELKKETNNE